MTARRSLAGFSLAEMAITLLIITLLSSGAFMALRVQAERSQFVQTQVALTEAKQALLAYAAIEGKLPCPAAATNDTGIALEDCNDSNKNRGLIPWKTLGIQGTDAWDRYLSYQVGSTFTKAAVLDPTARSGLKTGFFSKDPGNIVLTETSADPTQNESVAFAIWSQGANGYGARSAANTELPASSNAAEQANTPKQASDTALKIYLGPMTDSFDDIGMSVSRYVLFRQMLDAGIAIPRS